MCDTAVRVADGRVLFAKNSDRDPNEGQLLEWHPARQHPASARLQCTWTEIPQVRETHAVLLSRPFWMWGAEIGANQWGVVIGNEAVFTRQPLARSGLTGMDLLRLALERAESAEAAVGVITALLETHGQGGGCGHEQRGFSYHNSFLLADPRGAFVLETAGRLWQCERVTGARSISNGLTLEPLASQQADRLRGWVAQARGRRACSEAAARDARRPGDMMRLLRDHGPRGRAVAPRYRWMNGAMGAPCVHAGGRLASSQTTASWVSELSPSAVQHWATGTAAPCTGLFKPVAVHTPMELGPAPADRADSSLWWRHERLQRTIARDPRRLLPLIAGERDQIEGEWLVRPPESGAAFAEGDRLLDEWTRRVVAAGGSDQRPGFVRRYWATRAARAGLTSPA
jgi:hypothetical protein